MHDGMAKLQADDFVIGFTDQLDAKRVMEVLPKRFENYGLKLHPTKTRLVRFPKPNDSEKDSGNPESFDLLGFTHYWGRSKRGEWVVRRKTSAKRVTRALQGIREWCRANMHKPLTDQQRVLGQKLRGHCAYYGITGNGNALSAFRARVQEIWRHWLNRRNRERSMTWEKFALLLARYPLPAAVAIHSLCRRTANP